MIYDILGSLIVAAGLLTIIYAIIYLLLKLDAIRFARRNQANKTDVN